MPEGPFFFCYPKDTKHFLLIMHLFAKGKFRSLLFLFNQVVSEFHCYFFNAHLKIYAVKSPGAQHKAYMEFRSYIHQKALK